MSKLFDTPSRKLPKIFLVGHLGPQYPKLPLELIFDLFGGPWGPFSKNPKIYIFQISNFPGQFSRLLLDLESWNFFWYALILCLADSSIPHCLVWFGLVWTGIWCHFWKSALLKKAIDKFLIFLLKRDYPTILHWCLKAFAVRSFLLGVTTNFQKNSVPASRSIILAPIGPRDLKFFVVASQMMPNKM